MWLCKNYLSTSLVLRLCLEKSGSRHTRLSIYSSPVITQPCFLCCSRLVLRPIQLSFTCSTKKWYMHGGNLEMRLVLQHIIQYACIKLSRAMCLQLCRRMYIPTGLYLGHATSVDHGQESLPAYFLLLRSIIVTKIMALSTYNIQRDNVHSSQIQHDTRTRHLGCLNVQEAWYSSHSPSPQRASSDWSLQSWTPSHTPLRLLTSGGHLLPSTQRNWTEKQSLTLVVVCPQQ